MILRLQPAQPFCFPLGWTESIGTPVDGQTDGHGGRCGSGHVPLLLSAAPSQDPSLSPWQPPLLALGPTLWGCKAQPPPLAHEGPSRSCRSPKSAQPQAYNQPQGPAPPSHPSPSSHCPLCCVTHRTPEASSGSPISSALPAALRSSSWAWVPLGLLDLFATSGRPHTAVCFLTGHIRLKPLGCGGVKKKVGCSCDTPGGTGVLELLAGVGETSGT